MNQSQAKYVRERATAIYNKKRADIQTKYRPPVVDAQKLLDKLEAGQFTVDRKRLTGYTNWYNAVIFDDNGEKLTQQRDKELNSLETQYRNLLDELILGDNEEALALLRQFEKE